MYHMTCHVFEMSRILSQMCDRAAQLREGERENEVGSERE